MPYDRRKETWDKVLHDVTVYLSTAQATSNLLFHLNSGCSQKHPFDATKKWWQWLKTVNTGIFDNWSVGDAIIKRSVIVRLFQFGTSRGALSSAQNEENLSADWLVSTSVLRLPLADNNMPPLLNARSWIQRAQIWKDTAREKHMSGPMKDDMKDFTDMTPNYCPVS